MRAFVFTDPSLARHAGRFVWLEINRELAKNAEFRRRFPVPGIPTFSVIDPVTATEKVRWVGSFTVPELHAFLDDAAGRGDTPPALLKRLAVADSLYGVPADSAAAVAYDAVLAAAPAGWSGYPRVVSSLQFALTQAGDNARAVALAREALPRLGASSAGLGVAATALGAAVALPDSAPGRAAAIAEMEAATRRLVTDRSFPVAADDRSGAWIAILGARDDAKDSLGSRRAAEDWAAFLEGEAAAAKTPDERAVFDSHRLSAYMELGQPERAIPMLEASQRDLPNDYNPPYRLAIAYGAMKRWDDGLAAAARADTMMYGPRKLNLFDVRHQLLTGRGDLAAARANLEAAIRYAESLPPDQRPARRIAGWRQKLDALPASAGAGQ